MNNFSSFCYLKKMQKVESFQAIFGKNSTRKTESDFSFFLYIEKEGFLLENSLFQNLKKEKNSDLLNFEMFRKQLKTLNYSFKNDFGQSFFLYDVFVFSKKYFKYFLFSNSKAFLSFFQSFSIWKKNSRYLIYFPNLQMVSFCFQNRKHFCFIQKRQYFQFQQKFFLEKLKIYKYLLKFFFLNPRLCNSLGNRKKKTNSLSRIGLISESKKVIMQQNKKQDYFDSFFSQFFIEILFLSFSNSKNFELFEKKNIFLHRENRKNKEKITLFFQNYFSLKKNIFFVQMTKQKDIFLRFFWRKRLFVQFFHIFFSDFQFSLENFISKNKERKKDKKKQFQTFQNDKRNDFVLKTAMISDQSLSFERVLKKTFFLRFVTFSKSYILLSFYYLISNSFFENSNNLDFIFHHYGKLPFWNFRTEITKNPDFSFWLHSLTLSSLNPSENTKQKKVKNMPNPSFSPFVKEGLNFDFPFLKGERQRREIANERNFFFENVHFFDFSTESNKNFWQNKNFYFFQNLERERYFSLKNDQNKKKKFLFDLGNLSSILRNISLEKTFFHLSFVFQLRNEKNYFLKKSKSSIQFRNFLSFFNEFRENSSVQPIYLVFTNYFSNFLISNSVVYFFLKNQKIFQKQREIFSHLKNFRNFLFSQFCFFNLFKKNRNKLLYEIPFSSFFKLFHVKNVQEKAKSQNLIKFVNIFWNVSKQFGVLKSFGGKTPLYSISPFFANFLMYNKKSWKIKTKTEHSMVQNTSNYSSKRYNVSFDYNEFSISVWYCAKNFKRKFLFEKIPTFREVNRHLKECKQIIKSSIGKNQFSFMKKLQKKIQIWVNKYNSVSQKHIFSYCDSILFQFLWNWAQKTHAKKSKFWIRKKYFHFLSEKKWFFGFAKTSKTGTNLICLPLHAQKKCIQ